MMRRRFDSAHLHQCAKSQPSRAGIFSPGSWFRQEHRTHRPAIARALASPARAADCGFVRTWSGHQNGDIDDRTRFVGSAENLSKTERIDIRASSPVKRLLQEAARAGRKNVSEFLLDAGVTAATHTLADRRQFELSEVISA